MKQTLIKLADIKKEYINDEVTTSVLRGVSFEIAAGEFVAIMGPSGSGKSTLMHILGFLDRPISGVYEFEGRNVAEFGDDELAGLRNKKVGFVFQSYNLLPRTTVLENVKLPLIYSGISVKAMDEKAKDAVKAVGLYHRINHLSNQLSGGEQQRVAIARALVNDPKVIFADEPTGNLDSKSGTQVMAILEDLNESGHSIILVTHEQDTADHARRIIKIRDGLILADEVVVHRRTAKDGELRK
ncbi:MAG: ABC transporter ATP-binding protein [Candidatus Buchananbacteria bacterium]